MREIERDSLRILLVLPNKGLPAHGALPERRKNPSRITDAMEEGQ